MIAALLLAAYAAPLDDIVRPDSLDSWASPSGEEAAPTDWWTSFGDPGLDAILRRAVTSNRDIAAAFDRARATRAQNSSAWAAMLPSVTFDANAQLNPTASRGFAFGGFPTVPGEEPPKTYWTGQAAVSAGWEVDLFMKNQQAAMASRFETQAAEGDRDAALLAFASTVANGYFDVITARERLALVEQQVDAVDALLEIVELRYQAGDARSVDLLQQRQSAAQVRAQLPLARANVTALEQRLAVALGLPPATQVPGVATTLPDLPPVPDAGVPADLILHRPDLRAAEARIDAAGARHRSAVRQVLPTVRLNGSAGWQFFHETETNTQTFWSATGAVSIPLFNGGRLQNGIRGARAGEHAAVNAYTQLAANAVLEVENALLMEQSQRLQRDAIGEQLAAATAALDEAREQYVRGVGSYLTLLTAQNTQYAARLGLLDAERNLLTTRIQLHDALGGPWVTSLSSSLGANR